ncbi:hypothetical protein SESBI_10399 [Sesbania bispinosa]|nr:hypothetical protein SESBI_10399 [Sesbania bispinosa]
MVIEGNSTREIVEEVFEEAIMEVMDQKTQEEEDNMRTPHNGEMVEEVIHNGEVEEEAGIPMARW